MADGRWLDDVYGGVPPTRNAEMPPRFTRYLTWTWPLWFAATLTVGALWPRTADYGWLVCGVVWFAAGWVSFYQMDRVEYAARQNAKKGAGPPKGTRP